MVTATLPKQENRPIRGARRKLGAAGEEIAAQQLARAGFVIVGRNWRATDGGFGRELAGEIDLIAEENAPNLVQGGQVERWRVLIEVRTRRGDAYGTALQSITPQKARRMRTLAQAYIQATGWTGPWRIDVVAIQMDSRGVLHSVQHIRGAVQDA
jgi:putative endonuclease